MRVRVVEGDLLIQQVDCIINAGTGGGKPERVLKMMTEEALAVDSKGEVRIVVFR